LRKINGIIKKLGKRKSYVRGSSGSNSRYACLLAILWIGGCTSLKKAGLVSGASLVAASVTSAFSSGVTAPLLAGASTAFATSVIADRTHSSQTTGTGGSMPTAASCAPDNFWTLLGNIVEMGGIYLLGIVLIPMVLGWLLPGPLERKKKR
tara:strand:- start:186 stop:638 length:453 start_codon:yes stop_codon:yes gene_type:complete